MMSAGLTASSRSVWFLVGPYDSKETVRYLPIYTLPFQIGRRQDLALSPRPGTATLVAGTVLWGLLALAAWVVGQLTARKG